MPRLVQPIPPDLAAALAAGLAQANAEHAIMREDFGFVETVAGSTAGGVTASISFGVLFIGNVWVAPDHRGEGLGKALLAAAEAYGRERGAKLVCVDTLSTQAPEFYRSLGYHEFGRISGATTSGPVERIWFRKPL